MISFKMIICVTSRGQNPADFTVKLEKSIHFEKKFEIGVKSITHGQPSTFNVTKESNMFFVADTREAHGQYQIYTISPGYYKNVGDLMGEMHVAIANKAKEDKSAGRIVWEVPRFTLDRLSDTCELSYSEDSHLEFQTSPDRNDLLRFFRMFVVLCNFRMFDNIKKSKFRYFNGNHKILA